MAHAYLLDVGRLLKLAKDAIEWGAAIWHLIGWLGLTTIATGVAAAVGGATWAVLTGIPLPIALMAAYCTFVGAVYLAMAPMAFRTLAVSSAKAASAPKEKTKPNYAIWRQVDMLTLYQAACLWCGHDPHSKPKGSDIETRLTIFYDAVKHCQLKLVPGPGFDSGDLTRWVCFPEKYHTTTRAMLKEFAKARGDDPEFLHNA